MLALASIPVFMPFGAQSERASCEVMWKRVRPFSTFVFETLPIDNRYYRNFAYNERYLTVLPA